MNKREFIEYNNREVRTLYEKLVEKYKVNLQIKLDQSYSLNSIEILFINSEKLKISVGARPAGRTEWYVEHIFRGKNQGHSHYLQDAIYGLIQDEYEELDEMVRSFPKMEFIGMNNGFALTMDNHINLISVFLYTSPMYFVALVSFVFNYNVLGWAMSCFPTVFLVMSFLVFLFRKLDNKFLEGNQQEHSFVIDKGVLIRDKKQVKDVTKFTVYKYKNFIHIKTSKTFYVVHEEDCIGFEFRLLKEWFRLNGANVKIGI